MHGDRNRGRAGNEPPRAQQDADGQRRRHPVEIVLEVHDAEGLFRLENVEEMDTIVEARAQGYAPGQTTVSNVRAGETVRGVLIYLEPGSELEGLVTDAEGVPISNALIFIGPPPQFYPQEEAKTQSGRDGRFALDSLSSAATDALREGRPHAAVPSGGAGKLCTIGHRDDKVAARQ